MRRLIVLVVALLALVFVAAACTSDDGDTNGATDQTDATEPADGGVQDGTDDDGDDAADGVTSGVATGWSATAVGQGIKPTLALDSAGSPSIAYLFEETDGGFVSFASAADGWAPDQFVEGYFYGPLDLAFDPQDRPNIVYHDHDAESLEQDPGGLVHALRDTGWQITPGTDDGHDGWDSAIAVGADGVVRAAGIDPSQFGRTDGVEYYELSDGSFTVTAIGSGPIQYEFNVSLAVSPDGLPALTYYNDVDGDLIYASFDGKAWTLETVAADGNVGKFSSLVFGADGRPHVTFFDDEDGRSGRVMYAVRDGDAWTVEEVGALANVEQGMTGARRITSLALDAQGVPHVAFSSTGTISYATRSDAGWDVQEIVTAFTRALGQLVSLKLDAAGTPHLAFFEITGGSPLDGVIVYLTKTG